MRLIFNIHYITHFGQSLRLHLSDGVSGRERVYGMTTTDGDLWTCQIDADRAAMAQRARRQMLQRCLTRANKQQAEDNARQQLTRLIQAMGFNTITVTFRP